MLLFVGVTSMWATDPEEIYKNEGATGTSGGVTASGNINNTASNGNPAPAFGNTSASNKTFTFTGFSVSDYTNLELSIDAAFKNFPSTTNTWPYATVTFYKNEVVVKTDNTTIKWSSKVNTYSTYTIENIPDFDKIVIEGSPAVGKTGAGKDATNYGMYLDNIILTGENSATDPVVTFKQGDDVIDVLDLGNVGKNISKSATFSLSGSNLTAGKIELTAPTGFSVSPDEITLAADGSLAAQTITVSKNTTTVDTYADYLTIVGCGVDTSLIVGMDVKAPAFSITAGNLAFGTVLQYADHPTKIVTLKGQYVKDQVAVGTGSAIYGATPTRIDPDENGDFEQEVTVTAATEWSGAQNSYLTVSSTTSEFADLDEFAAISMSVTARYEITKVATGGTLVLSPDVTYAEENDEITLTANSPDAAHEGNGTLKVVKTATPEDDVTATVLSGSTLTMPAYDITVSATYAEKTSPTVNASPASLDFGSPKKGESVAAKTFDLTGVALTAGTLTLSAPSGYTVSPTNINVAAAGTLSAQTITVTPNTGTAGTYNDNISIEGCGLASAATVPLTMTVQETYTVNWYVNNSIAHSQTDIAGADLTSIPTVAVLPEDCSEKVFLGWGTKNVAGQQDLVNIEGITMPVGGANYYAVFATQEGEEGGTTTLKHSQSSNTNLAEDTNEAAKFGVDDNSWSIVGVKGKASNNVGLNSTDKDIRLYGNASGGNSLEVTAPKDIDSVKITFTSGYSSGFAVKVGSSEVEAINGAYPIEASSFVIVNTNSNTTQVRMKSINVIFNSTMSYIDSLTICPHCEKVTLAKAGQTNGTFVFKKNNEEVSSVKTCEAATVNVVATPAIGYELTSMELSGVANATYNAGVITIPANATGTLTATATFSAINYTVTMEQTGNASATLSANQTNKHYNDEITVTAIEPAGYAFLGWTASPAVEFANANALETTFNLPNGNVTVTAAFTKLYTVAEAIAKLDEDKSVTTSDVVVEGYVVNDATRGNSAGSLSYYITDLDANGFLNTELSFQVYKGYDLGDENFVAYSGVVKGAKVRAFGDLYYYSSGSKYELNENNYLISYEAPANAAVVVYGTASTTTYDAEDDFVFTGLSAKVAYDNGYAEAIASPVFAADPAKIAANTTSVNVTATYNEQASEAFPVAVTVKTYAITINTPIEHGSVGADLATAAKGTTVTLNNTPASGFKLTAYDVYKTGESSTKVEVTDGKFTMPAYAVTVSGSFSEATGFDNLESDVKVVKVLRDGQIYILRGEKVYTVQGQLVK